MSFQVAKATLSVFLFTAGAWCQTPAAQTQPVPIYHVTVIDRTVTAVNYLYRSGQTQIDFRGTVLLPHSKGDATVESKAGRTEIDARFQHIEAPGRFGPEYLTYVLWAITPEGHVRNLGEVMADASDKSHLRVTTDLQVFGMIVTAEPYAAVRSPSDVVVLENTVRPDTIGSTEPIRANLELLPRGTYTYNVPSELHGLNNAPKVSMDQYEQLVEIYQAQNAVKIAQAQGADEYAPEVITKAEGELNNAQQLHSKRAGRSMVVTAARTAAQTAEDARALTIIRKQEAQTTQVRDQVEREQRLRKEAEARAHESSAQADADRAALDDAKAQLAAAEARAAALSGPAPAPPPPNVESAVSRQTLEEGRDQRTMAARRSLLQEIRSALGPSLEIVDASRGLVVTVRNADFRGSALNQSIGAELLRLAAPVMRAPGLTVEVDGYTDLPGAQNEIIASQRAEEVRDALVRGGISGTRVVARGMGSSHPLGSNASAAGREQNRRVEIVIAGGGIGNFPLWDKTYALSSPR